MVGSIGLFAAAEELARRNWLVSPTIGNAPRTDLIAQQSFDSHLVAAIQVKTRTSGDFQLDICDPPPPGASTNEWVILASLGTDRASTGFCIVPRTHIYEIVRVLGAIYDEQEKPWPRKFIGEQEFEKYRGRWEFMEKSADKAPWLLPSWVDVSKYPRRLS